jgi:hypothetical protein
MRVDRNGCIDSDATCRVTVAPLYGFRSLVHTLQTTSITAGWVAGPGPTLRHTGPIQEVATVF